MGPDTGDQGQEAWGIKGEGETYLNLFFLCFLNLPDRDSDNFNLDVKRPREWLLELSRDRLWDLDRE